MESKKDDTEFGAAILSPEQMIPSMERQYGVQSRWYRVWSGNMEFRADDTEFGESIWSSEKMIPSMERQ